MAASEQISSLNGQLGWLALSYAWLQYADWRDREKFESNETRIVGPVAVTAERDRTKIMEYGERLRAMLSLVNMDDDFVPIANDEVSITNDEVPVANDDVLIANDEVPTANDA